MAPTVAWTVAPCAHVNAHVSASTAHTCARRLACVGAAVVLATTATHLQPAHCADVAIYDHDKTLSGADFSGRDLRGAIFTKANCKGANFADADLTNAQLDDANVSSMHFRSSFPHYTKENVLLFLTHSFPIPRHSSWRRRSTTPARRMCWVRK